MKDTPLEELVFFLGIGLMVAGLPIIVGVAVAAAIMTPHHESPPEWLWWGFAPMAVGVVLCFIGMFWCMATAKKRHELTDEQYRKFLDRCSPLYDGDWGPL